MVCSLTCHVRGNYVLRQPNENVLRGQNLQWPSEEANASYFLHCYVQKPWCFGSGRPVNLLHERKQLSKAAFRIWLFSLFLRLDFEAKRKKQNLIKRWKRRKKSKNEWTKQKKWKKMRNEKNETLIFYLIKRSVFSSFFHFVIFALAFTSSLNELMFRIFFIVMYKNFDVLSLIDL